MVRVVQARGDVKVTLQRITPPISRIDPRTHVIVSIINGMGDAFLALPVIRCLIQWFGSDKIVVWAPADVLETVLSDISCARVPLQLSRYDSKLFLDEERDAELVSEALLTRTPLAWVSLNAYSPLWPVEVTTRDRLNPPPLVWEFGESPEIFRFDANNSSAHMRKQYFHVIGEDEPKDSDYRLLNIPSAAKREADLYLKNWLGDSKCSFVTIHTDTELDKQWQMEKWHALAKLLRERLGAAVLALGRPSDDLLGESLIIPPPEDWHIQVALLTKSRGFVGVDSVFAHVADALGLPGLALFGPTSEAEWGPTGLAMKAISAPGGELQNLSAQKVFNRLIEIPLQL